MGADHGALITLDTILQIPFRHPDGHPPFFIFGGADREDTVRWKGTDRKVVTLLSQYGTHNFLDKRRLVFDGHRFVLGRAPRGRVLDFYYVFEGFIHGSAIHLHNLLTLFAKHVLDLSFEQRYGLLDRNDIRQFKEGRLHNHIDSAPKPHLGSDPDGIYIVKFEFFVCDGSQQ